MFERTVASIVMFSEGSFSPIVSPAEAWIVVVAVPLLSVTAPVQGHRRGGDVQVALLFVTIVTAAGHR